MIVQLIKGALRLMRGAVSVGDCLSLDTDSNGLPRIGQHLYLPMPDGQLRKITLDASGALVAVPISTTMGNVVGGLTAAFEVSKNATTDIVVSIGGGGAVS